MKQTLFKMVAYLILSCILLKFYIFLKNINLNNIKQKALNKHGSAKKLVRRYVVLFCFILNASFPENKPAYENSRL